MKGLWGALRRRRWILAVTIVVVLLGSTGTLWASSYDRHASRFLPSSTVVGGVSVGGLSETAAVDLLKRRLEAPLRTPTVVRSEGYEATTSAWDLGWRLEVRSAVRKALDRASRGGLLTRIWRRLSGPKPITLPLRPRWVPGAAAGMLEAAGKAAYLDPVPARLNTASGWVEVLPDQAGRVLDRDEAITAMADAVERGDRVITLPVRQTFAEVRAGAYASVILVRAGENTLHLYQNGQIVKSYGVATGTARYATPTGVWRVVSKLVDPVWVNPNSDWSRHMPARIGPGPDNPLGRRALALNAEGILIHATPDTSSIGFSASHGCIRMLPADEEDLFSRVGVGTPVVIVQAAPPKPRTATPAAPPAPVPGAPAPPAAPSPAQEAATQF